jgi:hypothetical protein
MIVEQHRVEAFSVGTLGRSQSFRIVTGDRKQSELYFTHSI